MHKSAKERPDRSRSNVTSLYNHAPAPWPVCSAILARLRRRPPRPLGYVLNYILIHIVVWSVKTGVGERDNTHPGTVMLLFVVRQRGPLRTVLSASHIEQVVPERSDRLSGHI